MMPGSTGPVAGVDIGNATTEVAVMAGGKLLGADRLPTRGRKGSAESVQGAAALLRRVERRLGIEVAEVSIAPLRAADTATLTVPALPPRTGRLTVLAAGVATPAASTVSRPVRGGSAGTVRVAVSAARRGAMLTSATSMPRRRSTRRSRAAAPWTDSAEPLRPRVGSRSAPSSLPPAMTATSVVALPMSTPATGPVEPGIIGSGRAWRRPRPPR